MIRDLVLASGGSSNIGVDWTYQSDMAVEWVKNTDKSPDWRYPTSIAWSGTQFCATGSGGSCATSPNGIDWTQQPGLGACGFHDNAKVFIRWGNGKFCAVGAGVKCATSIDGVTWVVGPGLAPSESTLYLVVYDMIWSGSLFCVVGHDIQQNTGAIATSPNGVNWTYQRLGVGFSSVAWTGTYFCASDYGGTSYISYDGASWQGYSGPSANVAYGSIAWGGAHFFLMSNFYNTTSNQGYTSPDGRVWTLQPEFADMPIGTGIVRWVDTQFVVADVNGGFATSPDGITWTFQPAAKLTAWGQHGYSTDMAWSGSRLCVVGAAYRNSPGVIFGAAVTSP